VTPPPPGTVLRRALVAWGLGHLALGSTRAGPALLAGEVLSLAVVAWLTIGLADSSAYLIPFLAGVGFIVAWAWQAIDAYRRARALAPAIGPTPERSPAAAVGWLSLPLLVWGTGFWLIGAHSATPAAVLDRFVTQWTSGSLAQGGWPAAIERAADRAASDLGTSPDRFRDVRVRVLDIQGTSATAVAEAVHFERREARFLWVFTGSELVPVADEQVLTLELEAEPVELPGGGDIGAVRWHLESAEPGDPSD
jgi:hypothetical protein